MRKYMIRKPNIYDGMSEASFSPGAAPTLVIALLLYVVCFLLREIPAYIIDMVFYSQQHVSSSDEAARVIKDYISMPGTMIAELLLTSVFLGVTLLYIRKVEKRPFSTLGFVREGALKNFSLGYAAGLGLFVAAAAMQTLLCNVQYSGFKAVSILFVFAYIVQALSEETVFRGFLLSSLTQKTGALPAVAVTSALYALLYISNYGASPLNITESFIRGALYAFCVLRAGSLWGAIGIHAAWNFAFSQVSPVISGDLVTDISAFRSVPSNTAAQAYMIAFIAVEAAAIAAVLFAGENRLVVRLSEERRMYYSALKAARCALRGRRAEDGASLLKKALATAGAADGDAAKTAALLYNVRAGGTGIGAGFSEEVLEAVSLLESKVSSRINKNTIAREVALAGQRHKDAEAGRRLKRGRKAARAVTYCPLLRREIEPAYCSEVAQAVDSGDKGMMPGMLNTGLCRACAQRNSSCE